MERDALQSGCASSGKRLKSELRQRLQPLQAAQLELLVQETSDERSAMAWLVNQVNRFSLSVPNTRSPISGCTSAPMPPDP